MLRGVLIAVGVVCVLCALVALATGAFPPAAVFGVAGLMLVAGTLFERVTYKKMHVEPQGADWVRTPERFVDQSSGKPVTVYIEPTTGERHYVQE